MPIPGAGLAETKFCRAARPNALEMLEGVDGETLASLSAVSLSLTLTLVMLLMHLQPLQAHLHPSPGKAWRDSSQPNTSCDDMEPHTASAVLPRRIDGGPPASGNQVQRLHASASSSEEYCVSPGLSSLKSAMLYGFSYWDCSLRYCARFSG